MDYFKALEILKKNLKKVGVKFNKDKAGLYNKHFTISASGQGYWHISYSKMNITISTRSYPHSKKYLRGFDIKNGDYKKFKEKIDFIIKKDKEEKIEEIKTEQAEEKEFSRVANLIKKYNPKIDKGYDITIDTPLVKICFYPDPKYFKINLEYKEVDYKNITKLIDKLKEIKK